MSIDKALLAPIFLHILLILVVGIVTLRARIAAVRQGKASFRKIAIDNSAYPDSALKPANNLNNQFQIPVVWYACIALLLVTQKADMVAVVLSWLFLVSRVLHSVEHITRNDLRRRMPFFFVGFSFIVMMWVWFALRLYVIG